MNKGKYKVRTMTGYRNINFGDQSNDVHIDDLYQGVIACAANPNYPAGKKNQWWIVSTAGKIGGASGVDVEIGDRVTCIADNAGGTQAAVGTSWSLGQVNIDPSTVAELRTGTANDVYVSPKTLKDQGMTTAAATILALAGGTTEQLKLTSSGDQKALTIASTVQTTTGIVNLTSTVADANCRLVSVTGSMSTAFTTAKILSEYYATHTTAATDVTAALVVGYDDAKVSTALSKTSITSFRSIFSGTATPAAGTSNYIALDVRPTITLNAAGTNLYGVYMDFSGATNTTSSATAGLFINAIATTNDLIYGAQIQNTKSTIYIADRNDSNAIKTVIAGDIVALDIDAATTDHGAGNIIAIDVDAADIAAGNLIGVYSSMDETVAGTNGTMMYGSKFDITGFATGRADLKGYSVIFDGSKTGGDATIGFECVANAFTVNNAAEEFRGLFVDFRTLVNTSSSLVRGIDVNLDSTSASNALLGMVISKGITNATAAGAVARTNGALEIYSTNATTLLGNAMTVGGYLNTIQEVNSTTIASADVYSGTVFGLSYTATTTGAGTATNTARVLEVDYNLNATFAGLTANTFDVANIDFDTTGVVAYATGVYNLLHITGNDAAVPTWAATSLMNGLFVDLSGIIVTDADLTLSGVKITMPTAGGSDVRAIDVTAGRILTTHAPLGLVTPSIGIGVYGTPVVDTNISDNCAFTSNITTGTNKTNPGDSCMAAYIRVSNTADVTNARLQGVLASTGVAFDCYDAYGLQSNMTISAGAVATGNLTAVSGKVTVSDAVATGIISAGLFTLEGAFNPAALTYGVWIDITTGITADSGLIINNNASTCTNAINLTGTYTSHITSSTTMITDMPVTAPGAGFDTAGGVYVVPFGKRGVGGMIVTEIYVDLHAAAVSSVATLNDIIGEAAGGAAYIGQITAANNGTVQFIEVVCLEAPTTGDADIDIASATANDGAYNADVTALAGYAAILTGGANWTQGMVKYATAMPAADTYLYLASGNGGVAGAYDAGKFLIRIYGV